MYIIVTVDHRGLSNAICEDSAKWVESAWALTITEHAEIKNVEDGRQFM